MKPTPEEFERWRESSMTELFMSALKIAAAQMKDRWVLESWGSGNADPMKLHALRERAGAYIDATELTLDSILALQAASEPE